MSSVPPGPIAYTGRLQHTSKGDHPDGIQDYEYARILKKPGARHLRELSSSSRSPEAGAIGVHDQERPRRCALAIGRKLQSAWSSIGKSNCWGCFVEAVTREPAPALGRQLLFLQITREYKMTKSDIAISAWPLWISATANLRTLKAWALNANIRRNPWFLGAHSKGMSLRRVGRHAKVPIQTVIDNGGLPKTQAALMFQPCPTRLPSCAMTGINAKQCRPDQRKVGA